LGKGRRIREILFKEKAGAGIPALFILFKL